MTRLQHVHARVRHAAGHRKPVAAGPAFRLTALMTGLAIATTTLAVTSPRASAAEPAATRRPASDTAPATARTVAVAVPDRASAMRLRSAAPPEPGPDRPESGPADQPPLLDIPNLEIAPPVFPTPPGAPPPGTAPPDAESEETGPATQGVAPENAPPGNAPPEGTAPEGTAPQNAGPQSAPPQGAEPQEAAAQGLVLPDGIPPVMPEKRRLEQGLAKKVLAGNGVRWSSTGGCSKRTVRTCTSFDKIRWGTVKGVIRFAKASGCDVTVTGGTERGHASGTYSHWNGYKADIAPTRCVDRAIERFPSAGVRGDGAKLYRSPGGVVFAREKDHWDITFK